MEMKEEKEGGLVGRILAKIVGQELTQEELDTVSGGKRAICYPDYDSIHGCDGEPQLG